MRVEVRYSRVDRWIGLVKCEVFGQFVCVDV